MKYTGTSVNPARSIGSALFQGGEALNQLWVFIVGPFVGAMCTATVWRLFSCSSKCCNKYRLLLNYIQKRKSQNGIFFFVGICKCLIML